MIVYGVCIGNEDRYRSIAGPTLEAVLIDRDVVVERRNQNSIFSAYNHVLEVAREEQDLEAVVLVHEDVRLSNSFRRQVVEALTEPDIAVAGCIGARRPPSLRWWHSQEKFGHVHETRAELTYSRGRSDVHTVDGLLLVLSPWTVRNLRFDEHRFTGFHAYADDLCFSALAAGRRVVVADFAVFHATRGGFGDLVQFVRSDLLWRRKWRDSPYYSGRRWDLVPGVWHVAYFTARLQATILELAHRRGRPIRRERRERRERPSNDGASS